MKRAAAKMRVIGLMSGTSADGIDAALVEISGAPPTISARLAGHHHISFPAHVRKTILRVANDAVTSTAEISELNFLLGEWFAKAAIQSCRRHRVRMYNKFIDEYLHNACTILTFATAFRPSFLKMPREAWLAQINKAPLKRRAEYKRSVIEHGLASEFVLDAVHQHKKLLSWMTELLAEGPHLAGATFSNADAAVIPYILRLELLKLSGMWAQSPAIGDWWMRVRERPSVKGAIFDRMGDQDWAPFKNLAPDPWPMVEALLKAAA